MYPVRFKLHLRPKPKQSSDVTEAIPPLPPNKFVTDVFADFFRYLFQCVKTFIIESTPNGQQYWKTFENNIDYVLSHPNGWEGLQQTEMRRAAIIAGLVDNTPAGRSRIQFVTEGEASLHYCIMHGLSSHLSSVSLFSNFCSRFYADWIPERRWRYNSGRWWRYD